VAFLQALQGNGTSPSIGISALLIKGAKLGLFHGDLERVLKLYLTHCFITKTLFYKLLILGLLKPALSKGTQVVPTNQ